MGTLKEMLSADRFAAEAGVELLGMPGEFVREVHCLHWPIWHLPLWLIAVDV